MRGQTITQIQGQGHPLRQRPATDVRYCQRCGARLARDNQSDFCSPCQRINQTNEGR